MVRKFLQTRKVVARRVICLGPNEHYRRNLRTNTVKYSRADQFEPLI